MKKNRMMRLASILLVCVLLTTSVISGTFAKYTTSVESKDAARVANWGFQASNSMDLTNLFLSTYSNVNSKDSDNLIAPGTAGSAKFQFKYDETSGDAPEVSYKFTVAVSASCDPHIKENKNIQWKLDTGAWGTWDNLIKDIQALSGDASGSKSYTPGTLPAAFGTDDKEHTIEWQWIFNETESGTLVYDLDGDSTADATQDEYDTYMGNMADLEDVSIKITISATQVD